MCTTGAEDALRSRCVSAADLEKLCARCEADPSQVAASRAAGDALALEVGGELELRWRVAVVRAAIETDPDAVREAYGELVDHYRDEPARLAQIKPLGERIRQLEASGALPSTLVVRSDRRKR